MSKKLPSEIFEAPEPEQKPLIQADFGLLKEFTLKDNHYRIIDFDNELSYYQYRLSKPIITKILEPIYKAIKIDAGNPTANGMDLTNFDVSSLLTSLTPDDELKLISLCYYKDNEYKFSIANYEERLVLFQELDLELYSKLVECLPFLFAGIMPLITKNFRIVSTMPASMA